MTPRDLFWRTTGAALVSVGYALTHVATGVDADLVGIVGLLVAAVGLLLLLAGKKVVLALRIERSRHRELPRAIRASRCARRGEL
ncbi:MAG: hypothetical protein EOP63_08270 [Sphingomonadales bacterium]|nr:MAG: hypothetical protein EOP63_08270 [Sphingomonadales bacterium]